MYSIFWKTLFSSLMIFFLFSNIAFTFDLVTAVNPAAITLQDGDYFHNYYFGVSSFIDSFKIWFGSNSALDGFSKVMIQLGNAFSGSLDIFVKALKIGTFSVNGGIIRYVIAIFMWLNSIIPMVLGVAYVLMFVIYILFIVFQVGAFIVYWFGGGFLTPLPDTSWYTSEYPYDWSSTQEYWDNIFNLSRAYMV